MLNFFKDPIMIYIGILIFNSSSKCTLFSPFSGPVKHVKIILYFEFANICLSIISM